jgi:RNA polymerase primary sigma factor
MINAFLPQVVDIAKLYSGQGALLEDLIGEGNVALATGVEMLGCLEEPDEVDGMLGKMIMDAMEDYIAENTEAKKVDMQIADKVNHISDLAKELAESLQRKITVEELAEETGIDVDEISEAVKLSGNKIEYFE